MNYIQIVLRILILYLIKIYKYKNRLRILIINFVVYVIFLMNRKRALYFIAVV